jgi:GMP synthase-like glutamine amidotransferase
MPDKSLLIIQHMSWEGPGEHLRAALAESGLSFRVLEAWHEPLPSPDAFEGLIVLGGSPNVDEEEQYPYLGQLKALMREVLGSHRALLGICLGHQLLGHVLGCRVGPLPGKSVGFIEGELTAAGMAHPVFRGQPQRPLLFKWHGQGILPPLPEGLTILAHSEAAPVEALGLKDNPRVVGVQFDNHVGAADVAKWLQADGDWALAGSGADPEALMAQARSLEAELGRGFRQFFRNFLQVGGLV